MNTPERKPLDPKAAAMWNAFAKLIADFSNENQRDKAEQVASATAGVSDESMARLYDIMQNVFAPTPRPLGEILNPFENVGSITNDDGGFTVEEQADGTFAVFQRGGFVQGGFPEAYYANIYARNRADEYAEGLGWLTGVVRRSYLQAKL